MEDSRMLGSRKNIIVAISAVVGMYRTNVVVVVVGTWRDVAGLLGGLRTQRVLASIGLTTKCTSWLRAQRALAIFRQHPFITKLMFTNLVYVAAAISIKIGEILTVELLVFALSWEVVVSSAVVFFILNRWALHKGFLESNMRRRRTFKDSRVVSITNSKIPFHIKGPPKKQGGVREWRVGGQWWWEWWCGGSGIGKH